MDSPESIVSAEEFFKVELRVGEVAKTEFLDNSEKLLRLTVNFSDQTRTILTGLRPFYEPEFFTGKRFVFAYNLAPRKMAGEESQGMLMCVDGEKPLPLEAPEGSRPGDKLK